MDMREWWIVKKQKRIWDVLGDVVTGMGGVQGDDGLYPWVIGAGYAKAGAADQAAWRIRHGKVRLPDVDGGDMGVWDAVVVRKVAGVRGKDGPANLWVRYKGKTDEMIGVGDG